MNTHPAADTRFGARALAGIAALTLVTVPFGLLLFLVQDRWDPLLDVDEAARDGMHAFAVAHGWFVALARTVSFLGSAWVGVPLFALVAGWLLHRRLPRLALFVVVTVAGSAVLNAVVKVLVDRARPILPDPVAHASGFSFPSGHAQSAVVWVGVLLLVFAPMLRGRRRVVAIAAGVCWVLAVGFARVSLGVHYVSDVLAGYVLGTAWVIAMAAAFNAWRVERGHRPVEPSEGLEPDLGSHPTARRSGR